MRSYISVTILFVIMTVACKTQKKTAGEKQPSSPQYQTVSDIELFNKPADTIMKYIGGRKWQMLYATGGLTGSDVRTFPATYYTFNGGGTMEIEQDGKSTASRYTWEHQRDIFTADSIYVIGGPIMWKVEGIDHDTLRIADNFFDGYRYALIRSK